MNDLITFVEIMLINIVLSGDNAVVIGMASKNLPERQRSLAIFWGSFAAVLMRILLTLAAVYMLRIPLIQAIGAVLLLYIGIKLLADDGKETVAEGDASFWRAVWTILAADFVMSLDNVLAIAALAQGNLMLIIVGVALSIPLIIWGSAAISGLLRNYPALIYLGSGLLGYTAGKMFAEDKLIIAWFGQGITSYNWVLSFGIAAAAVAIGHYYRTKIKNYKKIL